MIILSHRGYWKDFEKEGNKRKAFERSFDMGFGTETDIRDFNGEIVISHDMPSGSEITFKEMLEIMAGRNLPLALNIKADGLAEQVESILSLYGQTNYFTFDMSIPELVYELNYTALNAYTGCSDVSPFPPLLDKTEGVWLDSFFESWSLINRLEDFIYRGKNVCVVSEDLHSRKTDEQWFLIKQSKVHLSDRVFLCTNYPEKARAYFAI